MTLYKWLNPNGQPTHGRGRWELPNGKPGAWRDVSGPLEPCANGIHACREQDLVHWIAPELYEFEARGDEYVESDNKVVVRSGRLVRKVETWNDQAARLFACDCATYAIGMYGNDDDRSWNAIFVAQRYALGLVGAAAMAAAWDAAWAAMAAAWDAAWAARAAARPAARPAARAAAAAAWAAMAAAGDAADAAGDALTHRLLEYLNGSVDIDAIRESVS